MYHTTLATFKQLKGRDVYNTTHDIDNSYFFSAEIKYQVDTTKTVFGWNCASEGTKAERIVL